MKPLQQWLACVAVCSAQLASAQYVQPMPESASAPLLEHFYQEARKWADGTNTTPAIAGLPAASANAIRDAEFNQTRTQLRGLGSKAWPLAPRFGELLIKSSQKQYDLGWMVTEATPTQPATSAHAELLRSKYEGAAPSSGERLGLLAALGKTAHPDSIKIIAGYSKQGDINTRLVATIALGYAGRTEPSAASSTLSLLIKDPERVVRQAAVNSIRLAGREAIVQSAPALIDYLRTRENVFAACSVLKELPTETLRPIKAELESIISDPRLTAFQKQDAVSMLIRIESETPPPQPKVIG
jgi:hypothetical protein